jgi:hypothetical protein
MKAENENEDDVNLTAAMWHGFRWHSGDDYLLLKYDCGDYPKDAVVAPPGIQLD